MSIHSTGSSLSSLRGLNAAKRLADRLAIDPSGIQAVLLYGASGSGKSTVGLFIAKAWMCLAAEGRPCGRCPSCRAFECEAAVDFLTVRPAGDGNYIRLYHVSEGESPQGSDAAIPIQRFLRTMPIQSASKVVLIEDADRMTEEASNSLLKMLEEPEPYARFVLTSSKLSALRTTIRSRCICTACELPDDPIEDAFMRGASVAERQSYERFDPIVQRIRHVAQASLKDGRLGAMRDSFELREIAKAIGAEEGGRARSANLKALELLARAYMALGAAERTLATIEAHQSVQRNGSFGMAVDNLFARFQK